MAIPDPTLQSLVDILLADTDIVVAQKTASAVNALIDFSAPTPVSSTLIITNAGFGAIFGAIIGFLISTIPLFGQILIIVGIVAILILTAILVYYIVKGVAYLIYYLAKGIYHLFRAIILGLSKLFKGIYKKIRSGYA